MTQTVIPLITLRDDFTCQRVSVEPVGGTDYSVADRLQQEESVSVGVAFSLGFPQPDDLRYRLIWVDTKGEEEQEGRVPVDH